MDYKDLIERYWRAETTTAEEQQLREQLSSSASSASSASPSAEERAARAMMRYAERQQQSVNIRLHHATPRYWQMALAAGLCSLAVILTIHFTQPTVYGYYNGEPITSLAEAQYHAERVFANLAQAELPTEEELMQKLFLLNE